MNIHIDIKHLTGYRPNYVDEYGRAYYPVTVLHAILTDDNRDFWETRVADECQDKDSHFYLVKQAYGKSKLGIWPDDGGDLVLRDCRLDTKAFTPTHVATVLSTGADLERTRAVNYVVITKPVLVHELLEAEDD